MTDYRGGRSYVRDLAGNIVKAFTEVDPPEGGAITVTDGDTTVEGVTTLTLDGLPVSADGQGVAVVEGSPARVYYGEEDPGAVGAGAIWIRSGLTGSGLTLFLRNEADDGWLVPILADANDLGTGTNSEVFADDQQVKLTTQNDAGDVIAEAIISAQTGALTFDTEQGQVVRLGWGDVRLGGLPSTDPGSAGQLYTDGAPGPDDPKALMVSGGTAA